MQQQNQIDEEMISSLLATARDESKTAEERYGALKHVCRLRGDHYQHVPIEQIKFLAAAIQYSEILHRPLLSFKDATDAVTAAFARRTAPSRHG